MEFEIVTGSVESLETDRLIIGVAPDGEFAPSADLINKASAGYLKEVIGDLQGKAGETLLLHKLPGITAKRVLLVGLGKADERSDRNQLKIIKSIMTSLKAIRCKSAVIALDGLESADKDLYRQLRHNTEWASAELYQYDATNAPLLPLIAQLPQNIHLSARLVSPYQNTAGRCHESDVYW